MTVLHNKPPQESHLLFEELAFSCRQFNSVALVTLQDTPQIIQVVLECLGVTQVVVPVRQAYFI